MNNIKKHYVIYERNEDYRITAMIATTTGEKQAKNIMKHYAKYLAWNLDTSIAYEEDWYIELNNSYQVQYQEIPCFGTKATEEDFRQRYMWV